MISHNDQLNLFTIISKKIRKPISCYAFGGNAMMFYGYKDETKDVDLAFENNSIRTDFVEALTLLGFVETSPVQVYLPEKLRDKNRPLVYKREDIRFDLFSEKIINSLLSPTMKEDKYAVHEFRGAHTLTVNVLRKEHLVFLKAITERKNDFEDIKLILEKDKHFDWQYLIDEALWQDTHGDGWALLDVEKTIKSLQKDIFIEEKYLKQLYKAKKK